MRQHAGKVRAGCIRPIAQAAELRARQIGNAGRQCANCRIGRVPCGDVSKQHDRIIGIPQRCNDAFVGRAGLDAVAQVRNDVGNATRFGSRHGDAGQHVDKRMARDVVRDVKEIFVLAAVGEADLRARYSRLAHPVRDDRCFGTDIRARNQYRVLVLEIGDATAQRRIHRIVVLVQKVAASSAVVDIRRIEVVRELRQQVTFFDRDARCRDDADFAGIRFAQRIGRCRKRVFPVNVAPLAALLYAGLRQPVLAVNRLVTESIAIRNPRFVDALVDARHDALDRASEHMRVKIGAHAVVR